MQVVTGAVGDDVAEKGVPEEGEVAGEVEHLVSDELVGEPEGRVQDAGATDDDGVVEGAPLGEAARPQRLDLALEGEGPGGGQLLDELLGPKRYGVARDPQTLTRSVNTGRLGQEVYGLLMAGLLVVFAWEQATSTWFYRADEK